MLLVGHRQQAGLLVIRVGEVPTVLWVEAALVGKGQEVGVVTTEEEGDVCKEVVVDLATWAQAGVTRSIHKDTTEEMAMPL